jgi:hypothetical protein
MYVFVVSQGKPWDGVYVFAQGLNKEWALISFPYSYISLSDNDAEQLEALHK